jgi:Putative Actinobacterial Holin-X, holin superfamily III
MAANKTLATQNRGNETLAAAVTDVSERVTVLIREEIELAKAETVAKVSSLARGLVAVGAGAVFGVFAVVMGLLTLAWGLSSFIAGTGKIWIGFGIVFVVLLALTATAFMFAWRKLKVGAPTPKMAIEEAKKISATVRNGTSNGEAHPVASPPPTGAQATVQTSATPGAGAS